MFDSNFINVTITQEFDFNLLGIKTKEEKLFFLQRMCDDSKNKPITKDDKAIGIVNYSTINSTNDGIIINGTIWCNVGCELYSNDREFGFSSIVLGYRK